MSFCHIMCERIGLHITFVKFCIGHKFSTSAWKFINVYIFRKEISRKLQRWYSLFTKNHYFWENKFCNRGHSLPLFYQAFTTRQSFQLFYSSIKTTTTTTLIMVVLPQMNMKGYAPMIDFIREKNLQIHVHHEIKKTSKLIETSSWFIG